MGMWRFKHRFNHDVDDVELQNNCCGSNDCYFVFTMTIFNTSLLIQM